MTEDKSLESYPDKGYSLSKFVQGREIEYTIKQPYKYQTFGVYGEYEDLAEDLFQTIFVEFCLGLKFQ